MKQTENTMETIFTHKQNVHMKRESDISLKILMTVIALFFIGIGATVQSQITFANLNTSPSSLVDNVLLGVGVTATNVTYNGSAFNANSPQNPVREFTNTSAAFPLSAGVIMQTNGSSAITDPDLAAISSGNITNGSIIEFDFVPDGDTLSFSYIFTSAEYSVFTCSNFNDVFGFFISGPGITGPFTNNAQNIAIVPGSANIPVGINTVNAGTNADINGNCNAADPNWQANSIFFTTNYNTVYNTSSAITTNFNGSTVELTANASVICGATYHIKLAISNVVDQGFDSGVFLKAGSFASEPAIILNTSNLTNGFLDSVIVEGCHQGEFCFDRLAVQNANEAVVYFNVFGSATRGVDFTFTNLPHPGDSIVLAPGVNSVCINLDPIFDGIAEGPEGLIIEAYTINACGDSTFSYGDLWIADTPIPLAPNAGADTVVCSGGLGTLNGTATRPTNNVIWTFTGPGIVTFTPDNQTIGAGVSFDTPGQYQLFLTESNDSCATQAADSMIVIYEELTFNVSNDTIICENGEATMVANATGGVSFEYHWNHTANFGSTQSVMPNTQTGYIVYAESSNGCVTPTEPLNVDVLPPITLTSTASQTICPGESIIITATANGGNGGPYTYSWTSSAGINIGYGNIMSVSPSLTETYTVTVIDDCESTPKVSTSEVVVAELPEILFDVEDGEICTPAEFVLFNQTDPLLVQDTYWYISDDQTFMGNDTINVAIKPAGVYGVLMVIVTPDGCVDSLRNNEMLTVYPKPNADFTYYPKPATILNSEVNFQNYSEDSDSYQWSFEGGIPLFSSLEDPKAKYPEGEVGSYEVELIAISMFDCRDTITKIVTVISEVLIFAPNSFTPDGDELNPTWKPVVEGIDEMNVTVEIFNRWGEKIWESNDLNFGWDGTYGVGGSLVKSGTYIWKIKATNLINDDKYVWDGFVNVIY